MEQIEDKPETNLIDEIEIKSVSSQQNLLKRQINVSFLFCLMHQCEDYSFVSKHSNFKENYFIRLKTISNNDEIIYQQKNINTPKSKICKNTLLQDEKQIQTLAELLQKEKGIVFKFKSISVLKPFEIIEFKDENGNDIEVESFLNEFYYFEKVVEMLDDQKLIENEKEIENEPENNCIQKTKWSYHDPEVIEKIIQEENSSDMSEYNQRTIILRKINSAMIYYLLLECENYNIIHLKGIVKTKLIPLEKIMKEDEIVYDVNDYEEILQKHEKNKSILKRKYQMEKLAEIIEKEKGLKFNFTKTTYSFELIEIIDENEKQIDLIEFLNKYDNFDEIINHKNNLTNTKLKFQNSKEIHEILKLEKAESSSFENQYSILIRKLNSAMIMFLKKTHKYYKIKSAKTLNSVKHFNYLSQIRKGGKTLFDIDDYSEDMKDQSTFQIDRMRKKLQMEKLAEIIENESGMKMIFSDDVQFFQLLQFVDKDNKPVNLYEFVKKYAVKTKPSENEKKIKQTVNNFDSDKYEIQFKSITNEWFAKAPKSILKIITDENALEDGETNQKNLIIKKINFAMINFLLKECEGYTTIPVLKNQSNFFYLKQIMKGDYILYDYENEENYEDDQDEINDGNFKQRKMQLNKLAELIDIETGIKFGFYESSKTLELSLFVDQYYQPMDLYEFVKKYETCSQKRRSRKKNEKKMNDESFSKDYMMKRFDTDVYDYDN